MKGVYGDVFFNFGQPINVRDWIGANFVDSQGNGKINVSTVTHRLAHHVIERLVHSTPVNWTYHFIKIQLSSTTSLRVVLVYLLPK